MHVGDTPSFSHRNITINIKVIIVMNIKIFQSNVLLQLFCFIFENLMELMRIFFLLNLSVRSSADGESFRDNLSMLRSVVG